MSIQGEREINLPSKSMRFNPSITLGTIFSRQLNYKFMSDHAHTRVCCHVLGLTSPCVYLYIVIPRIDSRKIAYVIKRWLLKQHL